MPPKRELGRGERVLPGLWRLRLPLPWPGIPHCNAWAIATGDGVVLVDTGMHEPGSMDQLERALHQVKLRVEHVRLLGDHARALRSLGSGGPIVRAGGLRNVDAPEPRARRSRSVADPEAALARRIEVARQSGVPPDALRRTSSAPRTCRRGWPR